MFVNITHLDDIKRFVEPHDHFVIIERDYGYVVDYLLSDNDTFQDPFEPGIPFVERHRRLILRECRGLIFDTNGDLISRPLHKFHNIGEKPSTMMDKLPTHQSYWIMEKLDGSMVRPFRVGDGIRWGTRKGITDVSMQAEVFVAKNPHYQSFASMVIDRGFTPIFEWVSRKQRIVLDYTSDDLILLAIRHNISGHYASVDEMVHTAKPWNIPTIKLHNSNQLADFVSELKQKQDTEGVVIRFEGGSFVKAKTDWYVLLHKTKDLVQREKDAIAIILDGGLDDILPTLPEQDRDALIDYQHRLFDAITGALNSIKLDVAHWIDTHGNDKRSFAVDFVKKSVPGPLQSWYFTYYDIRSNGVHDQAFTNYAKERIIDHCSSNSRLNQVRPLFSQVKWIYDNE